MEICQNLLLPIADGGGKTGGWWENDCKGLDGVDEEAIVTFGILIEELVDPGIFVLDWACNGTPISGFSLEFQFDIDSKIRNEETRFQKIV